MDEEIPAPIVVAIVAGYDGTQKPTIGAFTTGNNFDLGLDFELNENDEWAMVVTNKQDYEQPGMQQYLFPIVIDGKRVLVQIQVREKNIQGRCDFTLRISLRSTTFSTTLRL